MGGNSTKNDLQSQKTSDHHSEMNKIKMERWIQMHYQMHEREMALEIAKNRELFLWLVTFYTLNVTTLIARFNRMKRFNILTPIVPLTFAIGYFADLAYGSKLHRIRQEADQILQHESEMLEWPCGLPTVSEIDQARLLDTDGRKFHPPTTAPL